MEEIDKLIEKWQEKHSELLLGYSSNFSMFTFVEALTLRSEMCKILQFIDDLNSLKTKL